MARVYKYVAAGGAGSKNGSSWANAFDEPAFESAIENGSLAVDTIFFIKGGTYTLNSAYVMTANGSEATPILFIGVKSTTTNEGTNVTYSDWAFGDDRPLFACTSYAITLGVMVYLKNIRFTSAASPMITTTDVDDGFSAFNCKFTNDGAGYAIQAPTLFRYALILNCEFEATNGGHGLNLGFDGNIINCYFHSLGTAIDSSTSDYSTSNAIINCIFNACTVGATLGNNWSLSVINNTFYACGTAIAATICTMSMFVNNIFEGCTTGACIWSGTQQDSNIWWGNHGNDTRNTDMFSHVAETTLWQDYLLTSGDPLFITAGSNFQLQANSPCLMTGVQGLLAVG